MGHCPSFVQHLECPFLSISVSPVGFPQVIWVFSETKSETSMGLGRKAQGKSQVEKTESDIPRAGRTEMLRWTHRKTDMGIERKITE